MSKATNFDFVPGHLSKDSEYSISNVPIVNGQVIISEKSGLQFIDYADTRHTYGAVLTGIFNGNNLVQLEGLSTATSLNAIKINGNVVDGQVIKSSKALFRYRKILDNNFIVKIDESDSNANAQGSKVGFIMHFFDFSKGDLVNIDLLVSLSNETNNKLYLIKIVNNQIDLSSCRDLDGTFDLSEFGLTVTHHNDTTANRGCIFAITANNASSLKVISYSASSTGSAQNEGLYVVESDL